LRVSNHHMLSHKQSRTIDLMTAKKKSYPFHGVLSQLSQQGKADLPQAFIETCSFREAKG